MDEPIVWQPLLRDTLAALAAPPEEQACANGPGCLACDLLNDFDHARLVALGNAPLSDAQRASLGGIDAQVEAMQQPDFECFNNEVVLRPAWRTLRELAGHALREFGWEGAEAPGFVEIEPGLWHRPLSDA